MHSGGDWGRDTNSGASRGKWGPSAVGFRNVGERCGRSDGRAGEVERGRVLPLPPNSAGGNDVASDDRRGVEGGGEGSGCDQNFQLASKFEKQSSIAMTKTRRKKLRE